MPEFLDPISLIKAVGLLGIFAVVFAESGLLIGFFLPGDSLLFTAGLLAARGDFNIFVLLIGCFIAAVAGDSTGYAIGRRVGPRLFKREDSLLFRRSNIERTQAFYEKYGKKTIVLARFMPVVRTFAPILAGVGRMEYRTFFSFNVIGGFLWSAGLSLLGFALGESIPDIDRYLLPIIGVIILVSALPVAIELLKNRRAKD